MRHYKFKKEKPSGLPHNLYMQIFYIFRDYMECGKHAKGSGSRQRTQQWAAAAEALETARQAYLLRPGTSESLDALHAFFNYPYFSLMFAQKSRDAGASKRTWSQYRTRLARQVAEALELLPPV
ncbi:MAG: hypothetical protein E7414_01790 [Ruminococcaceae bacterium]|nr:hypothetical protein [Oscillospiraceae bacterium]